LIRRTLLILALLAAPAWAEVEFDAPTAPVPAYTLVRCELADDQPGDAWWIVSPDEHVDDFTSEDGRRFYFVGPPGRYTVRALTDEGGKKDQGRASVTILPPAGPTPGPTPPGPSPGPNPPPGPTPSPQDPPGPTELGLARMTYDLGLRLNPTARAALPELASALRSVDARTYVRTGHDDAQGFMSAAWSAMKAVVPASEAAAFVPFFDAIGKAITDLGSEGAFFDDDGYLDATRYGAGLAEVADGAGRAGGSR
jgi:hypothetical protein